MRYWAARQEFIQAGQKYFRHVSIEAPDRASADRIASRWGFRLVGAN